TLLLFLAGCRGRVSNSQDAITANSHGFHTLQQSNYDAAIANLNEAIRLNPTYDVAFNNRGLAYFNKGDLDKALTDFEEALRLNPSNDCAYSNRGMVFYKRG